MYNLRLCTGMSAYINAYAKSTCDREEPTLLFLSMLSLTTRTANEPSNDAISWWKGPPPAGKPCVVIPYGSHRIVRSGLWGSPASQQRLPFSGTRIPWMWEDLTWSSIATIYGTCPSLWKRSVVFRGKWYVHPHWWRADDPSLSNQNYIRPKTSTDFQCRKAMRMPSNTQKGGLRCLIFVNSHLPHDVLHSPAGR